MNEEAMIQAIRQCIELKGTEVLADKKKFKCIIQDLLPSLYLQKERNILFFAVDNFNLGKRLLTEAKPDNSAREYYCANLIREMTDSGLSPAAATAVIRTFTLALGWNVKLPAISISPDAAEIPRSIAAAVFTAGNADKIEAYKGRTDLTDVSIPKGIGQIGESAFAECINMTSLIIPDSVASICKEAFSFCSSLNNIQLPDSLVFIDDSAFESCRSLTVVNIPNSVKFLGKETFFNCSKLEKIIIPDSVKYIGRGAFELCFALKIIIFRNQYYADRNEFNEAAKACAAARDDNC
ncbi:leucine-rich repeat domain-containing protein [bacterium]|nr:leucine-rich repeat domain-containing protein [bacterium]